MPVDRRADPLSAHVRQHGDVGRRWAWLVTLVLLSGACGHPSTAGRPSYGFAVGGSTTSAQAGGGGAASGGAAANSTVPPRGSGGTAPTAARSTTTQTPRDDGSSSSASASFAKPDASLAETAGGPPGAFARTILRPAPATAVVLERLEQSGAAPRQATIDHLVSVVGRETAKPVRVDGPVALSGGARDWKADEIRALADAQGQAKQGGSQAGSQAVVRLLFLKGTFEGNDQVLGVAVRGDVVAIFTDQVTASATPLVGRSLIERAVVTHEMGHTLGLVDLVLQTGREDRDHPGHSTNQGSVMYWAVESSLVGQVLNGGPPDDFDDADRADLAALRGGA